MYNVPLKNIKSSELRIGIQLKKKVLVVAQNNYAAEFYKIAHTSNVYDLNDWPKNHKLIIF